MHVFDETPISELFVVLQERSSQKRWSVVHIHGALLSLRHLFDFKKGHKDQMGVEGQVTDTIVTRFLQDFKSTNQHRARKRKTHDEEESEG
jgi:hypothetical protein